MLARRRARAPRVACGVAVRGARRRPARARPRRQRRPAAALPRPVSPLDAARAPRGRPGRSAHPRKLGHVNFLTGAIDEQVDFYTRVLGMTVTDWLGDGGVWLHINGDHHVMALIDKGYAHFHHLALRRRRHRPDARRARPPRPPRPLARLGPDAPRHRRQHRLLRADRRGGVLRRALLRHGAARARARAAPLARRPLLVEHLGPAAAALATSASTTRRSRPSARAWRCGEVRGDAAGLHDPAHDDRPGEPGPAAAVALRRRLPRRRLLGRSRRACARCSRRASTRIRTRPLRRGVRRLAVVLARAATSCVDPIRSHYREFFIVVNALLDGEEVTTCPFIWVDQDFALARGWIQGFPKKLGSIWMTRTFGLDRRRRPRARSPAAATAGRAARAAARSPT